VEKLNIVEVLEYYGASNLNKEARGWKKVNCPFHDDSVASATYSTKANAFNCFGCGVKGDGYKIIMEREGIGFREAYLFAEEKFTRSSGEIQPKSISGRTIPTGKRFNSQGRKPIFLRRSG
jgi:DNA primase